MISGLYNLNFESKIFWIFVRVLFLVCMSRNFSCEICLKDVKVFIIIIEVFDWLVNLLLWLKGDLISVYLFIVLYFLFFWSEGVDIGVGWLVGIVLGVVGLKVVGVFVVLFLVVEMLLKIMNMNISVIFILKNIFFFFWCYLKV